MTGIQLRDRSGQRKYLTRLERERFLRMPTQLPEKKRLFYELIGYTGCRLSEAHRIQASGFDLDECVVILETLKRRRRGLFRTVPVPRDWIDHAVSILSPPVDSESIWSFSEKTGYRAIKARMLEVGIDGAHANPKGLRHAFGIAHAEIKTNPRLIQRWLGHASLNTTMIYLDAQGMEERNAAKALW